MVVDSHYQCAAGFSTVQRPSNVEDRKKDDVSDEKVAANVYYVLTVLHSLMTHHKNTRAKIKEEKDVFKSVYMLKEDISP
jgi:hypothetical protein